ncbi:hypothetical protein [Selenomonas sp. AE3005]|nr:hypothetical protein [Selenomonas sp. AE3005]
MDDIKDSRLYDYLLSDYYEAEEDNEDSEEEYDYIPPWEMDW